MEIIETQEKSGPNCIFPLNTGFRFDQQMFLGLCKYFCRTTHNMHVQIIYDGNKKKKNEWKVTIIIFWGKPLPDSSSSIGKYTSV